MGSMYTLVGTIKKIDLVLYHPDRVVCPNFRHSRFTYFVEASGMLRNSIHKMKQFQN